MIQEPQISDGDHQIRLIYEDQIKMIFDNLKTEESSNAGESHPRVLTEPDVNLSIHPALIILSPSPATLPYHQAPPITG